MDRLPASQIKWSTILLSKENEGEEKTCLP